MRDSEKRSLRTLISSDENEVVIFGADNFSQYPLRIPSVRSKCDRALAAASEGDVVVLREKLDRKYHAWLRGLGLSTDHVVEYGHKVIGPTLAELILKNPLPLTKMVKELARRPVYAPWFSGHAEEGVASVLGGSLFGANESETLRYNDKSSFKALCQSLNIALVSGSVFQVRPDKATNFGMFVRSVRQIKDAHGRVLIRGTLGVAGTSLYTTTGDDLDELYQTIVESREPSLLIEPFLKVHSSPNDQWVIDRNGNVTHIELIEQECERGLIHVGNVKGAEFSTQVRDTILETSRKIVFRMAENGYCGVVGIDYIVTDEGIFPIETNARFNGSSYVHLLVDRIEEKIGAIPHWKFVKLSIPAQPFSVGCGSFTTRLNQATDRSLCDREGALSKSSGTFPFA